MGHCLLLCQKIYISVLAFTSFMDETWRTATGENLGSTVVYLEHEYIPGYACSLKIPWQELLESHIPLSISIPSSVLLSSISVYNWSQVFSFALCFQPMMPAKPQLWWSSETNETKEHIWANIYGRQQRKQNTQPQVFENKLWYFDTQRTPLPQDPELPLLPKRLQAKPCPEVPHILICLLASHTTIPPSSLEGTLVCFRVPILSQLPSPLRSGVHCSST